MDDPMLRADSRLAKEFYGPIRGLRRVWSAGGPLERFFLLCPLWWGGYVALLLVLFAPHSFSSSVRILVVGFTFGALLDAWLTPIASTATLRATLGTGLNRNDETISLLADYFDSLRQGGHWRTGVRVSLAYLIIMFAWGLVAADFGRLTGLGDYWAFFPLYLGSLFILWAGYRILFRRLLVEAGRAGYHVQSAK